MQGNEGENNLKQDDNKLNPSFRGDAKHRTRNLEIPGSRLRVPRNDATQARGAAPHFPSASAMPCQIWSLISVADGLGMMVAGPCRLAQATTSRRIQTSPSV